MKMKLKVLVLAITATSVNADPFDDYERQNNQREPVTVLSAKWAKRHRDSNPEGLITFHERKWHKDIGVARYVLVTDKARPGWMAFRVANNKVIDVAWTPHKPNKLSLSGTKAQALDIGSTALALSQGFVEANPIADGVMPAMGVAKLAIPAAARKWGTFKVCMSAQAGFGKVGGGAALWNLGLLAHPALGAALAVGYVATTWKNDGFWHCVPKEVRF